MLVTGATNPALLIASHIKPWCECDNAERLDGYNGLLLSPHIDKLFDRGWITFTDAGDLLCAEPSIEQALLQWGITLPSNVGIFSLKQAVYLTYHRDEIFTGQAPFYQLKIPHSGAELPSCSTNTSRHLQG